MSRCARVIILCLIPSCGKLLTGLSKKRQRVKTPLFPSQYPRTACLVLEKLFECRDVPHIVRGQRGVPVDAVIVFALDRVIAQVDRLVEIIQAEFLRAEAQVALPANKQQSSRGEAPRVITSRRAIRAGFSTRAIFISKCAPAHREIGSRASR